MPLEISMTNEEKVRVTASPTTKAGQPAPLDGNLRASVVSGDGSVNDTGEALTVELVSSDQPGDVTFLIEGDADLGDGVQLVQDTVTVHVLGAVAANLGLTIGSPEPK